MIYFLDRYHLDQYVNLVRKLEDAKWWLFSFLGKRKETPPKWRE